MVTATTELPPRARRIHQLSNQIADIYGTTSACAENTGVCGWFHLLVWNYLRVRGEYLDTTGLALG